MEDKKVIIFIDEENMKEELEKIDSEEGDDY